MRFFNVLKRVAFSTCAINTLLILLITVFASVIPALQRVPFKLSTVLIVLLFSFLVSIINLILFAAKPGTFLRIVIHYFLTTLLVFLFTVIMGGFAGESTSRSSVLLLAMLIYTIVYVIIAATALIIHRIVSKNKNIITEEYESQF